MSTYWGRYTLTGIPTIARPLASQTRRTQQTATFTASPSSGYDSDGPLTFQWQRNGATLVNGPSPTGSVISGASTSTLTIEHLALADAGQISYNVANSCGGITSNSAALSILPSCPGDANADGIVDFLDLNLVLGAYGSSVAPFAPGDLNGDGQVDFTDLNLVLANFGGSC